MAGTIEVATLWTPGRFPRGRSRQSAELKNYLQPSSMLKMTAAKGLLSFTYMLHAMERKLRTILFVNFTV
jgi:hypothetical protein